MTPDDIVEGVLFIGGPLHGTSQRVEPGIGCQTMVDNETGEVHHYHADGHNPGLFVFAGTQLTLDSDSHEMYGIGGILKP